MRCFLFRSIFFYAVFEFLIQNAQGESIRWERYWAEFKNYFLCVGKSVVLLRLDLGIFSRRFME